MADDDMTSTSAAVPERPGKHPHGHRTHNHAHGDVVHHHVMGAVCLLHECEQFAAHDVHVSGPGDAGSDLDPQWKERLGVDVDALYRDEEVSPRRQAINEIVTALGDAGIEY